jgi:hypothetical protein
MKATVSCPPRCGAWTVGSGANTFQALTVFITGKDKGELSVPLGSCLPQAKSGPNCGRVINPDSGSSILDSERQKRITLLFLQICLKGYSLSLETRGGPNMSQTSQPEIGHKSAIKQHQNRCRIGR